MSHRRNDRSRSSGQNELKTYDYQLIGDNPAPTNRPLTNHRALRFHERLAPTELSPAHLQATLAPFRRPSPQFGFGTSANLFTKPSIVNPPLKIQPKLRVPRPM
jgi:hypothetical protein